MTLHLPRPYPDELVGSMLQRGRRVLGLEQMEFLSRLSDHPSLRAHSLLFSRFEQLAHTYGLPLDKFVMEHTVLPYLMAFMKARDREQLLELVLSENGNYGPFAHRAVAGEQWLRRCPECVVAELREYGESYWHRVHQLSAVYVCVHHQTALEWTSQRLTVGAEVIPPHESAITRQVQNLNLPPALAWKVAKASANALWREEGADGFPVWEGSSDSPQLLKKLEQIYGNSFVLRYVRRLTKPAGAVWPLSRLKIPILETAVLPQILLQLLPQHQAMVDANMD